ncbi:ABC transporter substrate binding protein [uncultured Amphritea sp.]|uniref:ABC transporter substrate-binding protein n=1 Tax=uncultured Amphritea sp. TaxID=981605 RepID=UPI0026129243|nr:ABC transporter substrate binding protein [uncultured Amphritea sp.]
MIVKRGKKRLCAWLAGMLLLLSGVALHGAELGDAPMLNQGQKWRVAYYQGGEYYDYYQYLKATAEGLMARGWIAPQTIPNELTTAWDLWHWLTETAHSDYLEFLSDGFYSAGWDRGYRVELHERVITRLNQHGEVDLLLAMGSWAGVDMAVDRHSVPTMVVSVNDPRSLGLIRDQGEAYEHIYVTEDPQRYERQVSLFHDLIRFKALGVAYEDSFEGRSYASIEMIERLAQERGFKVISCFTQSDVTDQEQANDSVIGCFSDLAERVDALYVTTQGGVNDETIPVLVEIANQHRIPTFSQYGQREVKQGYLMSLSQSEGFIDEGKILSDVAIRILKGAEPASLENHSAEANRITLNLKTAEQIGLYLNAELLAAADQLYWQIEQP